MPGLITSVDGDIFSVGQGVSKTQTRMPKSIPSHFHAHNPQSNPLLRTSRCGRSSLCHQHKFLLVTPLERLASFNLYQSTKETLITRFFASVSVSKISFLTSTVVRSSSIVTLSMLTAVVDMITLINIYNKKIYLFSVTAIINCTNLSVFALIT